VALDGNTDHRERGDLRLTLSCYPPGARPRGLLCGSVPPWRLGRHSVPGEGGATYLLYLDESGTHGGSPVFILGGIAVHERDAWHLQNRLDGVLTRNLPPGIHA
jgi:hypothetical protein